MDSFLNISTYKPQILKDWIEYFIEFEGNGMFDTEVFAQPFAYILFNYNQKMEILYKDEYLETKNSVIEPITVSPFKLKAKIDNDSVIFGVKIKSTFLYLLTGIPLNLITGNIFKFDDIFRDNVNVVIEKINSSKTIAEKSEIAEKYFLDKVESFRINKLIDNYNAMKYLTHNFYNIFNIDQLINHLNVTHRTLDRHFLKYTGVTPKTMLSLIRFNKVIEYSSQNKTFDLQTIWNFGYYDYAHFSKDFKKFSGKTYESFKNELKIVENIQVTKPKSNILLPEIYIY